MRYGPTFRYASRPGGGRVAYQVIGDGDYPWGATPEDHEALLTPFRGREVKTTGDGFLATFAGPARAVRAADAIRADLGELDLAVRVGLVAGAGFVFDDRGAHRLKGVPDHWQLYAVELAGG